MVSLLISYEKYLGSDWATFYKVDHDDTQNLVQVYRGHPDDFWSEAAWHINQLGGISDVTEVVRKEANA